MELAPHANASGTPGAAWGRVWARCLTAQAATQTTCCLRHVRPDTRGVATDTASSNIYMWVVLLLRERTASMPMAQERDATPRATRSHRLPEVPSHQPSRSPSSAIMASTLDMSSSSSSSSSLAPAAPGPGSTAAGAAGADTICSRSVAVACGVPRTCKEHVLNAFSNVRGAGSHEAASQWASRLRALSDAFACCAGP